MKDPWKICRTRTSWELVIEFELFKLCSLKNLRRKIHSGRLTWNLQITHLERKMIFQTSMIMFHVNLPGCIRLNKNLQGFLGFVLWLFPEFTRKSWEFPQTTHPLFFSEEFAKSRGSSFHVLTWGGLVTHHWCFYTSPEFFWYKFLVNPSFRNFSCVVMSRFDRNKNKDKTMYHGNLRALPPMPLIPPRIKGLLTSVFQPPTGFFSENNLPLPSRPVVLNFPRGGLRGTNIELYRSGGGTGNCWTWCSTRSSGAGVGKLREGTIRWACEKIPFGDMALLNPGN